MGKPHGIAVILYDKVKSGTDDFGAPVYEETAVTVNNVLVGEPTTEEITNVLSLTGKRLAYTLGIPKGDQHVWTDRKVSFFGQTFITFGEVPQGIEDLIPLSWNKKVKVARYE